MRVEVIDVDVIVSSADVTGAIDGLVNGGYAYLGDCGVPERHAFEAPPHGPPRHVYVIVEGCLSLRNHLGVRDVLRSNAELRDEYGALKLHLATRDFQSVDDYVAAKSEVLQKVLRLAGLGDAERASVDAVNRPPDRSTGSR